MESDQKKKSSFDENSFSGKKGKNKYNWFRNYNTFTKFGKKNGLFSKDRANVEFLVLNDFELMP